MASLRKEKGLSQIQVAELLGVSRQAISRWEQGAALPTTDNLLKLAELYGVSVEALLKESSSARQMQAVTVETETRILPGADTRGTDAVNPTRPKLLYAFIAALTVLLVFQAGYLCGQYQAHEKENEIIPISELDSMEWDFNGADNYTFGWPDLGKEGE